MITREDLLRFREKLTWHGRTVFDFLLSVPLRDGQFQVCPNCGRDFHPRWQNIVTFPKVEAGSAFVISPEKGHENGNYPASLKQVCFLTQSAADSLNEMRTYRERVTGKTVRATDYIFTTTQHGKSREFQVSPIKQAAVKMLFYNAQPKANIRIYPQLLRDWVNSMLAAYGIDKQIRDIYLGHTSGVQTREQGYVIQMIPVWQQRLRETHALEALDIMNPNVHAIGELEKQIDELKRKDAETEEIMDLLKSRELQAWLRAKAKEDGVPL